MGKNNYFNVIDFGSSKIRFASFDNNFDEKFSESINIAKWNIYVASISDLTLYVFSTENWKRPPNEVNYLFKLLKIYKVILRQLIKL